MPWPFATQAGRSQCQQTSAAEPYELLRPKQWGPSILATRCCSHFSKCPVCDLDSLVPLHSILYLEELLWLPLILPSSLNTEGSQSPPHCLNPHLTNLREARIEPKNWSTNTAGVTVKLLWNSWFLTPCLKNKLIQNTDTTLEESNFNYITTALAKDIVKVMLQKKRKQQMLIPEIWFSFSNLAELRCSFGLLWIKSLKR